MGKMAENDKETVVCGKFGKRAIRGGNTKLRKSFRYNDLKIHTFSEIGGANGTGPVLDVWVSRNIIYLAETGPVPLTFRLGLLDSGRLELK